MKICNKILQIGLLSAALGSLFGCSVAGRLQRQQATAGLAQLTRAERQERQQDSRLQVVKLQRDSNTINSSISNWNLSTILFKILLTKNFCPIIIRNPTSFNTSL